MRIAICALAALTLAACQKSQEYSEAASAPAADAAAAPERSPQVKSVASQVPLAQLAYRYRYAISAPAKAIRGLVSRHETACMAAGPALCQVVSANISEDGKDRVAGELTLRAQPAWLASFRKGLSGEAEAAGGRIAGSQVESEELTRQIVDTEAQVRARTLLRDRLERTLATRPGKLSELLELERELARVQGEIDAATSALAVMRTRVATSQLTVAYRSDGVLAPQGAFAPLGEAVSEVVSLSVMTLAFLIRILAIAAPLGALTAAVWWLGRRRGRVVKPAA